ncbi:ribosomal protein S18-alanine N-acetyltransferase [Fodinicola feengrottensis]|uniref:[Ribosomal protein bS18]-alanine N-acetyltransferase n=1 Tax=Fodinicola feengrottensis TaxID=435914 RepID=A0ABN2GBQ6_9ACTN|nr:ribosomal protein S18-alanine N-acetyltransferase [Fodinicola feengrottensis]
MSIQADAPTVIIDRMRWWHIDPILVIEDDLFGAERWTAGMFWSELAGADRYYRVAVEGLDEVVGYAGLAHGPDSAWVHNIAVRRDRQGRGLGARLLDDLLAEAVRQEAPQVALEVAASNAIAQRLYAIRGFEPVGVRKAYYQPSGEDAVVMVREM